MTTHNNDKLTTMIGNEFIKDEYHNLHYFKFSSLRFPRPEIYPNIEMSTRKIIFDY